VITDRRSIIILIGGAINDSMACHAVDQFHHTDLPILVLHGRTINADDRHGVDHRSIDLPRDLVEPKIFFDRHADYQQPKAYGPPRRGRW